MTEEPTAAAIPVSETELPSAPAEPAPEHWWEISPTLWPPGDPEEH